VHVRTIFENTLRWLEMFLWVAGCCALGYCALVTVDASITQGRSARSLKQTRERESHNAAADARGANAARNKTAGSIATGLVCRLDIPSIGLSSIVLEGIGRPQRIRVNDEISLAAGAHNFHYRVVSTELVDPHQCGPAEVPRQK
jgi:hypothetical protein